jgi:regulatory protein YycH of two-component signal transduction system YycFG
MRWLKNLINSIFRRQQVVIENIDDRCFAYMSGDKKNTIIDITEEMKELRELLAVKQQQDEIANMFDIHEEADRLLEKLSRIRKKL